MLLFKNLIPDYRFKKITDIKPELFKGAQLIVLDLDNTLVVSGTLQTKKEVIEWLANIKKNYHCVIFSNSFDFYQRAPKIAELFNCEIFLSKSKKPFKKLFLQLKAKYHFDNEKVFVVGDHIFTDILFGNSNNTKTILVDRLTSKESIFIKPVRVLENFILTVNK